jgi:hypothetical protein
VVPSFTSGEAPMAIFECKQGYTFRILAETEKEAMNILEKFYVEEDQIFYRPLSRIKIARSTELTCTKIDL